MIILQFVHDNGVAADLISWFGGGPRFSHVDSVMPDGGALLGSRPDVIGQVPSGVQIRPAGYTGRVPTLRVEIPATDGQTFNYYTFLRAQIGKRYNGIGILGFVVGRDWRNPSDWFCSELVTVGLELSKIILPLASPSNKITPADLILILSSFIPITMPF